MPRPTKCRKVCYFPQILEFHPSQGKKTDAPVILTVDEYEAIRLIDKEGLSQEQCCELMQIARTTVQRIYENARKKMASMLVDGLPLRIEGGDFRLCDGKAAYCRHDGCFKHQYRQKYNQTKGDLVMRVAVTYENGQIFQHFGHTEQFKVYDITDGVITSFEIVDTNGTGHGALTGILSALQVDALICGGIGGGAQAALAAAGIRLYGGVSGDADKAAEALAAGRLEFNPNIQCSHHGQHHAQGHACGEHGCGEHNHCHEHP
ncbi:DUF134 domain-containing protein [Clostridiaceae bacterium]|nr:DUF134 domain-containing protein [Clostridiaceae bacterium]RKI10046.1 DUF134 domain-containing protein [bacterium 1XD21-70]